MSIILNIESEEEVYELNVTKKKTIIGRSSKADVTITDERMSGRHCSVNLTDDGHITVRDLSSTNGTFLAAARIDEVFIMIGDKVRIGNAIMSVSTQTLTEKEAKVLTKSKDATQVRYLDLKSSEDSTQHAIKVRKNALNKVEKKVIKTEEDIEKEIDEVIEEEIEDEIGPGLSEEVNLEGQAQAGISDKTKNALKHRIAKKAKKVESKKNPGFDGFVSDEIIERDPETGKTGFIQIEKLLKNTKFKLNAKKAKTKKQKGEGESILKKFKDIFKKK